MAVLDSNDGIFSCFGRIHGCDGWVSKDYFEHSDKIVWQL